MSVQSTYPESHTVSHPEPKPRAFPRLLLLPIILAATAALPILSAAVGDFAGTPLLAAPYVDRVLKYQLITLGLALVVLALARLLASASFRKFFARGDINATVEPVKRIGLIPKPSEGWLAVGRNFAIIISGVTFIFIYLQAIRGNSIAAEHLRYLPWILAFSVANAFTEEMITRFAVVAALDGLIPPHYVYLASAAIFGLAHYFGTPGGIVGVLLAGFLGWLLAKSIMETRGIFWAWLIHALQDVIIFTGLFFVNL